MTKEDFIEWFFAAALMLIIIVGLVALIGTVTIELMKAMP